MNFDSFRIKHIVLAHLQMNKLTISVSKTPAAKMKIVCENCWTYPPQNNPTTPNNVIIIRDSLSARPCPLKSWKIGKIKYIPLHLIKRLNSINHTHFIDIPMQIGFVFLLKYVQKNCQKLTMCVGNISARPIFTSGFFSLFTGLMKSCGKLMNECW